MLNPAVHWRCILRVRTVTKPGTDNRQLAAAISEPVAVLLFLNRVANWLWDA
jgi:hypothetical protein